MAIDTVENVHLVFKTHLDLGFTDYARNVTHLYHEDFFPRAIELAKESRRRSQIDHFVWTTGTWLIYDYLEQAAPDERKKMDKAIEKGYIVWHALPFTTHSELLDPSLYRFGLSLSRRLDLRYGKNTTGAKMTDVPGHTRSIVPYLEEAGVKFLHLGINPSSMPPAVPPLFRWQAAGGSEVIVMIQEDYGKVAVLPDGKTAVAVDHTGDNHGPPLMMQVDEAYWKLRRQFNSADVQVSDLNQVADALYGMRELLPVVTSEIGDTWIHGTGADPTKMRRHRELCRLRNEWLTSGALIANSELESAFSRPLLAVAEHTWGMDEKAALGDYKAYAPEDFVELRKEDRAVRFEDSWNEQRAYIDSAIEALEGTPLHKAALARLASTEPAEADLSEYATMSGNSIELGTFRLDIGDDGSIISLYDKQSRRDWAGEANPFAQFSYQTFSYADNLRFLDQYSTILPFWAVTAFTKLGMEDADQPSAFWYPRLQGVYQHASENKVLVKMQMPEDRPYGCPERAEYVLEAQDRSLLIDFCWFDKNATRLPEAMWLTFRPRVDTPKNWVMMKIGQPVSPLDVVRNGNRKLHSIGQTMACIDGKTGIAIETFDGGLVAPGGPSLLDFNNIQPRLGKGMSFNLHNNVWCTNFPMWLEDDGRFRYRISFDSQAIAVLAESMIKGETHG